MFFLLWNKPFYAYCLHIDLLPVPETFGDYISKFSQFGDYISKFSQIWKIAKWIIQIGKYIYDKIN